ncbi:metalloregulator ArsR/SmtB family transcription factor [Tissierella sp. Yu-01]|uniref:ArsR/SmtB family transcription factor n=1 Tax=Tissierella sp. Yu-01 TaxID=3035694 RepID=UPI00240CFD34|nr:metalloregulator ArsR/SmtB family transcription factor [Tissierella sp. Yu-01]WFA08375.1 metalloregulator ArsR/SmtB family transcription factor [Tissierella sp. Yu-01]
MDKDFSKYILLFKALSDETRIKIVFMLSHGELCACDILEEFNITQPTLSYHMKNLTESGLVDSRKEGVWMKYSINKDVLELLKKLIDELDLNLLK